MRNPLPAICHVFREGKAEMFQRSKTMTSMILGTAGLCAVSAAITREPHFLAVALTPLALDVGVAFMLGLERPRCSRPPGPEPQ